MTKGKTASTSTSCTGAGGAAHRQGFSQLWRALGARPAPITQVLRLLSWDESRLWAVVGSKPGAFTLSTKRGHDGYWHTGGRYTHIQRNEQTPERGDQAVDSWLRECLPEQAEQGTLWEQ
jgi:hypothetical protein